MSIYRHIIKRRKVLDLTLARTESTRAFLERFRPVFEAGTKEEMDAACVAEFGSREEARDQFQQLPEWKDCKYVEPDQLSRRMLEATPVDITGAYPEDSDQLEPIEPRALPWRHTWLEDFNLGLGLLVSTDTSPCPCCDELLWTVSAHIFLRDGGAIPSYMGEEAIHFNDKGHHLEIVDGEVMTADLLEVTWGIQSYVARLLSCKNVEARCEPLPMKKGKRGKKRKVKKAVGVEWRVIEIRRKSKTFRIGGFSAKGSGSANRHHVVRGHFKTFTEEAPLLGRAVGTFFWGDFARGDRASGEIRKLYSSRKPTPLLQDAIAATAAAVS